MTSQDKIAFFPGKFQPPHIGHVITMSKIKHDYKKVLIGITEDEPRVMTPEEVANVFKKIFPEFDYTIIPGRLTEYCKTDIAESHIPEFDVLLTGNDDVINWAKNLRIPTKKIERAKGHMFSGTEIRKAMLDNKLSDGMEIRIRCTDKRIQSSYQVKGHTTLNDTSLMLLELKRMEHVLLDESDNYETIMDIRSDKDD